ncbi:MAG: ATP-binding protein [Planctomycetes bacterium]|nr:ATP-binding protein [Planctomycetota bacterium]
MNSHTVSLRFSTSAELTRAVFQMLSHILKTVNLNESNRDRFMLAVGEAIDNAVIHGNKFSTEKYIEVEYLCQPKSIIFMVSDEGAGFEYQKHLDTPLEQFQAPKLIEKTMKFGSPGGLGLALIRKCCDEVIYTPPGNKLTFIKYLDNGKEAR